MREAAAQTDERRLGNRVVYAQARDLDARTVECITKGPIRAARLRGGIDTITLPRKTRSAAGYARFFF